jgi:hypothetical protein
MTAATTLGLKEFKDGFKRTCFLMGTTPAQKSTNPVWASRRYLASRRPCAYRPEKDPLFKRGADTFRKSHFTAVIETNELATHGNRAKRFPISVLRVAIPPMVVDQRVCVGDYESK